MKVLFSDDAYSAPNTIQAYRVTAMNLKAQATAILLGIIVGVSSTYFYSAPSGRDRQHNVNRTNNLSKVDAQTADMLLFLHQRRTELRRSAELTAEMYWLPEVHRIERQLTQSREVEKQLRKEALERYGKDALSAPVFESLFYPMNSRFSFLSSEKQLKLQDAMDSHHVRIASVSATSPPENRIDDYQTAQATFESRLEEILSADEAYEYYLRDGEVSRRIRISGVSVSEDEFRDLYNALDALNQANAVKNGGSPFRKLSMVSSPYSEQVRTILGDERYLDFLKSEDPTYTNLARIAQSLGVAQDDIDAAYLVFVNAAEEIRATANQYVSNDPALRQKVQSLELQRDQEIRRITGFDLARQVHKTSLPQSLSDALTIRSGAN
jgi:hypothetical protein